ncbi:MAG: autotransporter-associated beta strand repeat-containing protein [Chthoniobacterales bacterium]
MKNQTTTFESSALSRIIKATFTAGLAPALVLLFGIQASQADSATWNLNPTNGDWNTAANWTPMTVPNGPSDVATFATSNGTGISLEADDEVSSIVFSAGASSYTITDLKRTLTISGAGVINNSGATQNFVAHPLRQNGTPTPPPTPTPPASAAVAWPRSGHTDCERQPAGFGIDAMISFINQASAGDATYSNYGAEFESPALGTTEFSNNATAANATFFNYSGFGTGGHAIFRDASTAVNAAFFNYPGETGNFDPGYTQFYGTASADHATFTCYGATEPGFFTIDYGGAVLFYTEATAAESVFTMEGGTGTQTGGGQLSFTVNSTAANSTITIGAGSNGGLDAYLYFLDDSLGGQARIILSGTLDMSGHNSPGVTTGSLEGSGHVFLGANNLTVGSNNLSTTFSGVIQDDGSLTKTGTGTLILSGANTYTGGTTIARGSLVVNNRSGSGTGSGAVQVNRGTLRGGGTISGAVTVGTGSGHGAVLSPGQSGPRPRTLNIQSALTLNSDATYNFGLNSNTGIATRVVTHGVIIISGAIFSFSEFGNGVLSTGAVFTVIDNRAGTPIAGTFSNLADGSIFTVGSNTFLVNYEGGDGNDLTLTVVPPPP